MAQGAPVITIDGPTASGKGTIALRVAQKLGFHYLDSGALYRLLALAALQQGVHGADKDALAELAMRIPMDFQDGRAMLDGNDVSTAIRQEQVGSMASRIATLPAVRTALLGKQRAFRRPPGLVADGRDMGTVVFPDAKLKVFLTASVESRAERRYKQLIEKGFSANLPALLEEMRERDARDTNRATAPLKAARGALKLDSTTLTIEQTVDSVVKRFSLGA